MREQWSGDSRITYPVKLSVMIVRLQQISDSYNLLASLNLLENPTTV